MLAEQLDNAQATWNAASNRGDLDSAEAQLRKCVATAAAIEARAEWSAGEDAYASETELVDFAFTRLALLLLQRGDRGGEDEGRAILWHRGFQRKLTQTILLYTAGQNGAIPTTKDPPRFRSGDGAVQVIGGADGREPDVIVVDGALGAPLFARLQEVFKPASPFWDEHNYEDQATGYFSYLHDLSPQEPSAGGAPQAGHLLSTAIDEIRRHAAAHLAASCAACTAEWWVQWKPHPAGHELHFDSIPAPRG